jgi:hypothetical protein
VGGIDHHLLQGDASKHQVHFDLVDLLPPSGVAHLQPDHDGLPPLQFPGDRSRGREWTLLRSGRRGDGQDAGHKDQQRRTSPSVTPGHAALPPQVGIILRGRAAPTQEAVL